MIKVFISFLLIFSNFNFFSQEITNVEIDFKNNDLVVTYDLVNCPSNTIYDIEIYIQKKGDTNLIFPRILNGSYEKVKPGQEKKITWNPLPEGIELNGEFKAILSLSNPTKFKIKNGPSNIFLSMILPGWGSLRVQSSKFPFIFTGGYIYSLYSIHQINNQIYNLNNQKLNSKTQSSSYEITSQIDELKIRKENYFYIASGIWLTDVLFTLIKGSINVSKQKNNLTNQPSKTYNLNLASTPQYVGFRFVKSF